MFGIEKDFQKLMEQVYGPHYGLGRKVEEESARIAKQLADNAVEEAKKMDEPVQYETPMTAIEDIEAQIKVLQSKLEFYKELEKTKSPAEEAYKDWRGKYPGTGTWDSFDDTEWQGFQAGYEFAFAISTAKEVVEEVQEEPKDMEELGFVKNSDGNWMARPLDWVKSQSENEVAEGLRSAMRQAIDEGVIPPVEKKQKTLTDIIERWWCDVFTIHSDWDMKTSIDDLVDRIQLWLPKEQSAAGSQNAYVECTVEGFNDCLNRIKNNLR